MPTTPTTATGGCPPWCDPRSHLGHAGHTSTPVVHRGLIDDVDVETAVRVGDGGEAEVTLGIRNLESKWPDGAPVEAEAALLPAEAEVLGYRLIAAAAAARTAQIRGAR